MNEYFRRMIIKFFSGLEADQRTICSKSINTLKGTKAWRHSGFSINNEIRIYGSDEKARENLSQYVARPPISLKKVFYEPFHSKVLFKTKYNDYFKENVKMFDAEDFIADLTLHIPPKNVQYIRRYGLYASRTRGIWTSMPEVIARAPEVWKNEHLDDVDIEAESEREDNDISISEKERRSAWARLLAKVYEVHAFTCPKCNCEMKIIALIFDPGEIRKILQHLVKIGRSPPGINPASLN